MGPVEVSSGEELQQMFCYRAEEEPEAVICLGGMEER